MKKFPPRRRLWPAAALLCLLALPLLLPRQSGGRSAPAAPAAPAAPVAAAYASHTSRHGYATYTTSVMALFASDTPRASTGRARKASVIDM